MENRFDFEPAFKLEVQVGQPTEGKTDPTQLSFPITGGTIEAGEKFTPRINSTSITGTDNAVLSEEESILHLNVDAEALLLDDCDDSRKDFTYRIQLQWRGIVEIGEREGRILRRDFVGETPLGNPIACFHLKAEGDELAGLSNRVFAGQGQFISSQEGLKISYHVSELIMTQKHLLSDLEVLKLFKEKLGSDELN